MPKTNVWRKKTVRYVHAKSGKRTTRNDPKAVQRTELSKRFYGNLRRSNNTRKQIPLTQDKTTSLTLLQRLQREADKDRALGITIADRRRDEPIDDYLDAYAAVLRGRGRSTLHVTKTFKRASDVLHDAGTYDDDRELTAYIWRNYRTLLTPLESLADKALMAEFKAEHSSPRMAKTIRERWGSKDDPDVVAALADGPEIFRDRVRDRVLCECSDEVILNRCSQCSRLVATPLAQQCLWCGHDWHSKDT